MTETASQLNARQGGLPPSPPSPPPSPATAAEAAKHTPLSQSLVEGWQEGQLGQAQPASTQGAQQTTAKAKQVGQLTLPKPYPTKRSPQVQQQQAAELADPKTEQPELAMCAATSSRVSSSPSTSQQQRSRPTYEQWLVAKNKADAQQRRRQRLEQQRQRDEQLQRQQLAADSFKLWLKGKQRQQSLPRVAAGSIVGSAVGSAASSSSSRRRSRNNASLPADVASRRYVELCQRRKLAELAMQRKLQQQRQQQQQLRRDLRRRLSDLAFERWLAQSAIKRQLKLGGVWRLHLQQQQQGQKHRHWQRQRQSQRQQQQLVQLQQLKLQLQQQLAQQQGQQQERGQQLQVSTLTDSVYLNVPLSAAQQALRDRLRNMNVLKMQRKRR